MRAPFDRFSSFRRFAPTLAFLPDGERLLFSSDRSGQFNLWRTGATPGCPEQLTSLTANAVRAVAVRAQDGLVAFAADEDGDEYHQLYLLEHGGWPERLPADRDVQHLLAPTAFSPDGGRLAFSANRRARSDMELWLLDVASREAEPVFGEGRFVYPGAWSPDGTRLLALDYRSNTSTSIFLVDAAGGGAEELTPHDEPARFEPGPWAGDGSGFWLLADEGAEFVGLGFYDLARGGWEWVARPEGDVTEVAGSPDGRVVVWVENDRGWSRLRGRDGAAELPEARLPPGTTHVLGSGLAVSRDGGRVAILWDQGRRPPEAYVVDAATGAAAAATESRIALPPVEELVEPELVAYPTWDRRDIPAWLYRGRADGAAPAVLWIHGGPESQERPAFRPLLQYLCSRGISVLATNVRGSTGYGKTYQRLIYGDWGNGDLRDFEAAAEWLCAQPWVDRERLGVAGGSYGGFATLSCLSRLPGYWAVGVDVFGPSNLVTLAQTVPPTWRRFIAEWLGDPDEDRERLLAASPLTHADEIRAPLLVIQGGMDQRVVKAESDQLVERLRALGREVEYVVFEDEGHGFTRYANEVRALRLTADFLERHLVAAYAARP